MKMIEMVEFKGSKMNVCDQSKLYYVMLCESNVKMERVFEKKKKII